MTRDITPLAERIIEQLSDALIYADRAGLIERWNRAAEVLFGYTADEVLGKRLDLIIPDHLRAAHWKGFDAAISSGQTKLHGQPTLTRANHRDGRKLYAEMTFALVLDANGTALGSVATARNATERVERERAAAHRQSQAAQSE